MRRRELESGSGQRPTGLPPHLKNNTTNVPIENGHHAHRDMNGTWCSEDKPKAQNQQESSAVYKTAEVNTELPASGWSDIDNSTPVQDTQRFRRTKGIPPHLALGMAAKDGQPPQPEGPSHRREDPGMVQGSQEPEMDAQSYPPPGLAAALNQLELDETDQDWNSANQQAQGPVPPGNASDCSTDSVVSLTESVRIDIEKWATNPFCLESTFLNGATERYENCDVNPQNGEPLPPVSYPHTRPLWTDPAQFGQTAAASSEKHILGQPPLANGAKIQERLVMARAANEAAAKLKPIPEPLPTPLPTPVRQRAPNPHQVQVSCHLRPATQYDMEAVTAIYNHEVIYSYKVMDTEMVKTQEFCDIYSKCETQNMPFAVAVEGPYVIGATTQPHVIGFALITAVAPGIAGSYKTQSCPGGKLLVIVKPEYRRKKLGAALIDLIFDSCSGGHASRRGYQFVNPSQDQRLIGYVGNPRQWFYIDMEVMVLSRGRKNETEEGEEYKWILEWLEVKFALLLVNHEKRFYYEPRSEKWVDRLTFRHVCRARDGAIPAFHVSRLPVAPASNWELNPVSDTD